MNYLQKKDSNFYYNLESIDNTNDFLKDKLKTLPSGSVCLSSNQTKGKGTKGRKWSHFKNKNLAISFLLKDINLRLLPVFPLVCGLIAKNCIDSLSNQKSLIKWPNDIILHGKKIAGILCESSVYKNKASIVCGTGINLNAKSEDFLNLGLKDAGSIFSQSHVYVPFNDATDAYLNSADRFLSCLFKEGSFNKLKEEYLSGCVTIGEKIKIKDKNICCVVEDVDLSGRLVCICGDDTFYISDNESFNIQPLYNPYY